MQQPPEYPQEPHPESPYSQPFPSQQFPTYQQPAAPYPHMPPPGYPPQRPPQKLSKFWRGVVVACGVIIVACVACSFFGSLSNQSSTTTKAAATSTQQTTATPTKIQPTPNPPTIQYPPKTLADLHGLAAQGTASAIYPFHSESVGAVGACPQPKRLVTVDPAVKDRQLAQDLLAYFYGQHLDSPCGAIVFVYHNKSEAGDIFTAGRIKFDVTDASGADNLDPNATDVQRKLTLNVGVLGEKEYVVTY
jgi:hypothetical protein